MEKVFEHRVHLMEFIEEEGIKSKTALAKKLGISRPTLYALLQKLDVNEERMAESFNKGRTKKILSFAQLIAEKHPDSELINGRYKMSRLILIDGETMHRSDRGAPRLLPEVKNGSATYYSWTEGGIRITIAKSKLIYMIANDVKEFDDTKRVIHLNGNTNDYRVSNLALETKAANRDDKAFLRTLKRMVREGESVDGFVREYFR